MDLVGLAAQAPRLAALACQNDFAEIGALYRRVGARAPRVQWSPSRQQIELSELIALYDHWEGSGGIAAGRAAIDPFALRPVLGYVMVLDVLPDDDGCGPDFRYRLYGTEIAARSGFDLTGRRVSDHRLSTLTGIMFRVLYQALLIRREPLLSLHEPPPAIAIESWRRLILPLSVETDGATIDRILVGNIPGGWRPPNPDAIHF